MTWAFIWMMFILKIPIAGLFWIVWRAITSTPEVAGDESHPGGGGDPDPRPVRPRSPRRGDHAERLPQPPARIRAVGGRESSVR